VAHFPPALPAQRPLLRHHLRPARPQRPRAALAEAGRCWRRSEQELFYQGQCAGLAIVLAGAARVPVCIVFKKCGVCGVVVMLFEISCDSLIDQVLLLIGIVLFNPKHKESSLCLAKNKTYTQTNSQPEGKQQHENNYLRLQSSRYAQG